jgi:filamentous hemagglutinin
MIAVIMLTFPELRQQKQQMKKRGWTETKIEEATNLEPIGTTTDTSHDDKGTKKNDPATVYGSKEDGHVIQNDNTGEIVQISDKTDPDWIPDPKIEWNDK